MDLRQLLTAPLIQPARHTAGISPPFPPFDAYSGPNRSTALFDDGLLAKPGLRLSMSGYGKSSQQPEYDNRSTQSQHYSALQQAPYTTYNSSVHYATPPITSQTSPTARTITHGPHQTLSEPLFSPRTYPAQPEIAGSSPNEGPGGTQYTVYLRSASDLTTDTRSFRLMFGSRRTSPELTKSTSSRDIYHLTVQVPDWGATGWVSAAPNVYLVIEDEQGEELGTMEAGIFTYTDAPPQPSFSPTRTNMRNRKRKSSTEIDNRAKRPTTASHPIRPKSEDYGSHGYQAYGSTSNYPSYPGSHGGDKGGYGLYSGYGGAEDGQASGYPGQTSPRHAAFPYQYPTPTDGRNPQSWGQPIQSGSSRALPSPDHPVINSPPEPSTPALIRTSTIQVSPTLPPPPANAASLPGFNPYSIYPHKAILRFQGELGDMAKHWSSDEWDSRRRLVQFWRNQKDNTIHTTFRPVEPNDRDLHGICISCIWWAEKGQCFVTSVDCIHLLESLIAVRFTVEEKNRIRRNLEGCSPQTVSKAKPETEAFFKLIMAFPAPKPRNIEKDVKVYPWSVLQDALRKIIGKYSASYSSTASVIPPNPSSSAYPKRTPSASEPSRNPQSQSRTGSASSSKAIEAPSVIPSSKPHSSVSHSHSTSPGPIIGKSSTDALPSIMSTSSSAHGGWPAQSVAPPLPSVLGSSGWASSSYLDPIASSAPSHPSSYYQRTPDDRDPVSAGGQLSHHTSSSANVP
ncbi:hypothetical protein EDC01DRAFT_633970 [Geopyxis carbonaria]|nr:hypothetical protein EDC01DRAFT_633970 [Geopyxis carbonaria]